MDDKKFVSKRNEPDKFTFLYTNGAKQGESDAKIINLIVQFLNHNCLILSDVAKLLMTMHNEYVYVYDIKFQ